MQESHTSLTLELARVRRKQRRATLVAVAACALTLGVLLGVALTARRSTVTATNPEANIEMSSAFVDIARRVEPAVVNISVVIQPHQRGGNEFPANDRPRLDDYGRGRAQRGNGSGVVIDSAGYILTNQHVIRDADRIIVKFFDGLELAGRVIGSDLETDLSVLKVEPLKPLPAARIGDSERIRVGEWVMAIGSPFNRHRGHHQRQRPRISRTQQTFRTRLSIFFANRRGDQSGQFGRAAHQPDGRSHRHQYRHRYFDGRLQRRRICAAYARGAERLHPTGQARLRDARLPRRHN
jgi:hypothetical protein